MKQTSGCLGKARAAVLVAGAIAVLCAASLSAAAEGRAGQAAAKQAAGGKRTPQQILEEIRVAGQDLGPLFASPQDLFDPKKREAARPKGIPALKKMAALVDELEAMRPAGSAQSQQRIQLTALLSALGDKPSAERLEKMAASPIASESAAGRSAQLFVKWLHTDEKPEAQQKVIDELEALAKQHPTETPVAAAALMLGGTCRQEAKELRQRIAKIAEDNLKGRGAQVAAAQLKKIDAQVEARQALKALEGKPLAVEGTARNGTKFSTAQWKGKVVLVDFWATWCAPCKEELPKLRQVYQQYHDQGLEVVGVSCDNNAQELAQFLDTTPGMPWPQLFEPGQAGWHPFATKLGINAIPTMFLIDRNGIVRSVEARIDYEKRVPELLKEKAK